MFFASFAWSARPRQILQISFTHQIRVRLTFKVRVRVRVRVEVRV